jgi:plastocyanin
VVSGAALLTATLIALSSLRAAPADSAGIVRMAGRPIKHAVVWLDLRDPAVTTPKRVVLQQKGMAFLPKVLAVRVGTAVEMPNSDRVFHNVFSFHDGKKFDLGLYPAGTSRVVTFDNEGVSRIFCNIHPTMAAYVVVVNSTHYAVTADDGSFAMPDVPGGSYTYHLWRSNEPTRSGKVSVVAGQPIAIEP